MTQRKDPTGNISDLRCRAESAYAENPSEAIDISKLGVEEVERLIHELRVHQIELEIQNEDLRQAQLIVEASRDKYADLYDFAPVGYLTLDTKGIVLDANLTAAKLLETDRQQLIYQRFSRFLSKEDADTYYLFLKKLFRSRERHTCEATLRHEGANPIDIQLDGFGVQDGEGNKELCRITVTDITDRKEAEKERALLREQLWTAQKAEAIGTLTGGIAHDFNNLLTIINGYTELILSETKENHQSYADLQKIRDSVRKGADLVKRLLAFSQKADVQPQLIDLNLAVENSLKLIRRTFPKIVETAASYDSDLSLVHADALLVEQILVNLFINAKESMPGGGTIEIVTKNVLVDEVYCRSHQGAKVGPHVLIEMTDCGRGMEATTVARIFDPFFTTKGRDANKGTGLGLSVAKGIVEQHGGWITCDSEPGKGSTFGLYFPAAKDSTAAVKPPIREHGGESTVKILLADDEELVRDLAKRFLEREGYTVITAANGMEALELFQREQAHIGLAVLDLIMPKMGGEQCLEELHRINPRLKAVVSSGHSLTAQERERLGVHAKGFANKPYELKQLLAIIKSVLAME